MARNYSQDDDRLEAEDCPCANTDEGFDPGCAQHGVAIDPNGEER